MPRGRVALEPRLVTRQNADWATPLYYIRWHDGGRVRLSATGARDRGEAVKIFARWLVGQEQKQAGIPASPRYSNEARIADVLTAYAEQHGAEVRFPERNLYAIKRLLDWWRTATLTRCARSSARLIATRAKARRQARHRRQRARLSAAALKWAERNGCLISAPFVKVPPRQPGKDRFLARRGGAPVMGGVEGTQGAAAFAAVHHAWALYRRAHRGDPEPQMVSPSSPRARRYRLQSARPAGTTKGRAVVPIPAHCAGLSGEPGRGRIRLMCCPIAACRLRRSNMRSRALRRAGLEDVTPHTLRDTCGILACPAGS